MLFLSENVPSDKEFQHLKCSDNITEIYLFPCFTNFNKLLQGEDPLACKLHKAQQRLICKLDLCFIKASIIQQQKEESESCSALSVLPDN